ncbi:MAG TPA: glycoside hydrolase family 43 protein [Chitinophagaceae bacterium]|nr:glycoside hydrolase family 43 protein [Chitinophagaceae bacterium]
MIRKIVTIICSCFIAFMVNAQSFTNPILAGYYPDPSICKAGNDYYIVNSSFAHYPGLPLFHSKDLLNWELIGYALDRPEQLPLEGRNAGVSRGLFAPAISYHKGIFYIVCTNVSGIGNFVVTAKDPKGPWSNPVALPEVNGIDPSLFFDDNDKAYIVYNSIPPNDETMWGGHRTIRMYQFDKANLKIKGEQILLVNGGTDVTKKPVWIEGPHIYKINDWYYLMCAQGGTGYNHTEVVFRSKNVYGPYWPYEKNPILTQMHLDSSRPNPITTTGHADLVEDNEGNWWGVFLGCRPYESDYYNTGRETFMAPVKWTMDGWPVFDLDGDEVKYQYPINATKNTSLQPFNGNYTFKDDFDGDKLNLRYRFLRTVRDNWYSVSENKGALTIQLRKETISGRSNPSFVGFSQPHLKGHAATALKFSPKSSNEKAGLVVMQNETHFYYLAQSVKDGKPIIELYRDSSIIAGKRISLKKNKSLYLKIQANNDKYSFYYATQENKWQLLLADADGKYLSTKGAGGFVGALYGMYATSDGVSSDSKAIYDWFEVKNEDEVYK